MMPFVTDGGKKNENRNEIRIKSHLLRFVARMMHRVKSSREIKTRDTDNIIWIRMLDADEIPSSIMT